MGSGPRLVILIGAVLGMAAVTAAQPPGAPPPMADGELREMLETVRIAKLTNAVEITPEQGEIIFPLIRQLERSRHDRHEGMRMLEEALHRALAMEGPEERGAAIQERIRSHLEAEQRFHREQRTLEQQILTALAPEQQARYFLFQQEFPRHMRETLRRLREERRQARREGRRRDR